MSGCIGRPKDHEHRTRQHRPHHPRPAGRGHALRRLRTSSGEGAHGRARRTPRRGQLRHRQRPCGDDGGRSRCLASGRGGRGDRLQGRVDIDCRGRGVRRPAALALAHLRGAIPRLDAGDGRWLARVHAAGLARIRAGDAGAVRRRRTLLSGRMGLDPRRSGQHGRAHRTRNQRRLWAEPVGLATGWRPLLRVGGADHRVGTGRQAARGAGTGARQSRPARADRPCTAACLGGA